MDMVKNVLIEELESSMKVQERYLKAIAEFPKGSLSKKKINGKEYYYLLYRDGSRVKTDYLGKSSDDKVKDYRDKIARRKRYERLLKEVRQKIDYLQRAINA